MIKLHTAAVAITFVALTLAGCGEEDGSYGSGGSNEFNITSFDNSYDNQANGTAVARIDWMYRTGERKIIIKNLVNNYNNQGLNALDKTVLADNFEGRLENKDIEVNERTVKRPIYEKNSNKKLNFETDYKTLSLSGTKANSYNAGNTISNSTGIRTDLNNYSNISVNATFPTGSVCYIPITTSEREFFAFNAKNETGYESLDKWVEAAEKRFSDNRNSRTSRFGVGSGNQQQVAQVTFFEFKNKPAYMYNGVEYGDSIYEADYIAKGTADVNIDSSRGVVDCTLVNDVAGDFLEAQIKEYY
ncbi:hypothetical protein [Psychrobacter sp. CAL346-MNA-CIBAN-0220]|uniref:hypothetical protein n=1 Tax=Psychrobacter sp. CAL346-MNA-CIBAN-0220 TaxID=3140457 RepID=UPI003324D7E2